MSSREEKIQRFLTGKKKFEQPTLDFKNSFFFKDWYLSNWFEKLIFVFGFIALLWTIFELLFLGRL